MQPTPLSGDQDRADFDDWIQLDTSADLAVRRG
jgi:hypothetical protein